MDFSDELKKLVNGFAQTYSLSAHDAQKIISFLKPRKIKKNEIFLKQGDVCEELGFLIHGVMYAWYESMGTQPEKISRFFYSPNSVVVASFKSFSRKEPADETIVASTDCFIICLSSDHLETLYDEIPQMNLIGRHIAENSYLEALDKIRIFQSSTTQERAHRFFDAHVGLYNQVSKSRIASYLEMNRNLVSTHYSTWNKK